MSILQCFFNLPKESFGTSFNSTVFNLSSSPTATAFTGLNCVKTITKAIFSPNPLCKGDLKSFAISTFLEHLVLLL